MVQQDQYFLGHSSSELERLQRQARELAPEAVQLFDRIGVGEGCRALEVGCGPLGCLEILSKRVGPKGSVVGVEMSADAVVLARHYLAENKIVNVEVRQGDGKATGLPRESFDLAMARLVLVNIPEPERIVAEMTALVKPGGVVALHEVDWTTIVDPPLAALDRLRDVFVDYSNANGMDPFVGRRVPRMLRAAGLVDIEANPILYVYPMGHPRRTTVLQFAENLRDRILARALMPEAEFDGLVAALKSHLEDPDTLVLSNLFIQAWGRKS